MFEWRPTGSDAGLGTRLTVVCYTPLMWGSSACARNGPLCCIKRRISSTLVIFANF